MVAAGAGLIESSIAEGVRGVRFIAAAVESAKRDAAWVALDDMQ